MYEDAIDSILGDLTPGYTPGQARVNALRGNEPGSFAVGAGGAPGGPSPMMQPPPQPRPMPPPGGATGNWGEPTPPPQPMPPGPPRTALPQAMGRPAPQVPPGPGSSPGGPSGPVPAADPLMTEYADLGRREQEAFAEQQRLHQPVDRSAAEAAYGKRQEGGMSKLILALAAQQAGEGFEGFQAQALKQAAEAEAPMKMAGGTMTPQGFIEDPAYGQEMKLKQIEARITAIDRARAANLTLQERRRLDGEKAEQQRRHEQTLLTIAGMRQNGAGAAGTWTPVGTDPQTQAPVFHNTKTNELSTIDSTGKQVPYSAGAYGPKLSAGAAGGKGGQVDPQHLIDLVGEARGYLKNATGSGLGAKIDAGANFFGASTKGAEATAKLNTVGGALVMAQPRMEGPQSDKDVALYKAMAGNVADATLPIQQRAAALDAIETLARKYQTGEYASPNRRPAGNPMPQAQPQRADRRAPGGTVDFSALPPGR